jgi:hypothetical protein
MPRADSNIDFEGTCYLLKNGEYFMHKTIIDKIPNKENIKPNKINEKVLIFWKI